MQLGMVGLGRMGANMVRRLMKAGHEFVVFARSPQAVTDLVNEKAIGASSVKEFVSKLQNPRATWLMIPAAYVDSTIAEIGPFLEAGDILIDGGNSYYIDEAVPSPVLTAALYERFSSRGEADFAGQALVGDALSSSAGTWKKPTGNGANHD